jgi:hypothetical protein
VSATFLSLMEAITPGGAFALYGVVCVLGYLFCYFVRDFTYPRDACHLFASTVSTRDRLFDNGGNVRAVHRVSQSPTHQTQTDGSLSYPAILESASGSFFAHLGWLMEGWKGIHD